MSNKKEIPKGKFIRGGICPNCGNVISQINITRDVTEYLHVYLDDNGNLQEEFDDSNPWDDGDRLECPECNEEISFPIGDEEIDSFEEFLSGAHKPKRKKNP